MAAMKDEIWTAHVLEVTVERERCGFVVGLAYAFGAEPPLEVRGEAVFLVAPAHDLLNRPYRVVGDRRGEAMLVARSARRVKAAEARTANGHARHIDVGAGREVVDAAADRDLVVDPRRRAMPSQRTALPGTIDHQDG